MCKCHDVLVKLISKNEIKCLGCGAVMRIIPKPKWKKKAN